MLLGWSTKATHRPKPTMESCSRSSSRVRLVLWSQEYFLLMESCRLRR